MKEYLENSITTGDRLVIGRDPLQSNFYCRNDQLLEDFHASFDPIRGGQWTFTDMGSSIGTSIVLLNKKPSQYSVMRLYDNNSIKFSSNINQETTKYTVKVSSQCQNCLQMNSKLINECNMIAKPCEHIYCCD